ncbi:MAG: DUF1990 family protein [Geodermatophilaceae bacterium]|nr:DUF1990 family protein [Geodermatophilaceae bacterium]
MGSAVDGAPPPPRPPPRRRPRRGRLSCGVAFSKPAMWRSRLGGPLNRGVQEFVTRRYLHSLDD